ncbi:MAG: cation:proton antiporter [Spirochaeta sp.]
MVATAIPTALLTLGLLVLISILAKELMHRAGIPPVAIYLLIGIGLSGLDRSLGLLNEQGHDILEFLGAVGIFALLFKAGLESDLVKLVKQLREAKFIWLSNVVGSAAVGFTAAYWIIDAGIAASLFVAVALSATSIGISVAIWQERGALHSDSAQTVIAVAEMDDISSVLLMVALFAVTPQLSGSTDSTTVFSNGVATAAAKSLLFESLFFALFAFSCLLFSRYIEPRITRMFTSLSKSPDPMLLITAVGMCIAAIAGLSGFSIAIGAFLAGLSFSRDPEAVKTEQSFQALYDFFVPLFFISLGAKVNPGALLSGAGIGAVLVTAVVIGKFGGTILAAMIFKPWRSSVLVSLSMIPHAEIAMVVASRGLDNGSGALTGDIFSGIILMVAVTSVVTPLVLGPLIRKWS